MRLTLALVGGHGVGKSTIGRALAERLRVPFHDEIGRRLLSGCAPDRSAEDPQEAFDLAVLREELARDRAWSGGLRVVETWHPGNLAYAARRSPRVADRYPAALADLGPALVLPIRASPAVAGARQNEAGDPAFYRSVGEDAVTWARSLGLTVLPAVDNDGLLDLSVRRAVARLSFLLEPA